MIKKLSAKKLYDINRISADQAQKISDKLSEAIMLATDCNISTRIKDRLCKSCFYISGYSSIQFFNNTTCSLCGGFASHKSTLHPSVCFPCSDKHNLCMKCGGDIDCLQKAGIRNK